MTDGLLAEHHDNVAVLTLNRPERRNALSAAVNAAIADQLDAWADDDAVRAVVLTGAGKAFCAGFDLTELGDPERQRRSSRDRAATTARSGASRSRSSAR